MGLRSTELKNQIREFDFSRLFIQSLGWDRAKSKSLEIVTEHGAFNLEAVAEKRGLVVFKLKSESSIPIRPIRTEIQRAVAKQIHENIIIYTDASDSTQIWQWPKRRPGSATQYREHSYYISQDGEALVQKLTPLLFKIEEEAALTIATVTSRAREAFDSEIVTKKFYDRFKAEHSVFLKFIKGINNVADKEWYASLTLNRLMFTFFIQKKGFLNGEVNYLQKRLEQNKNLKGKNTFNSFYKEFLIRLFHEGLGGRKRTSELEFLIGKVPYFNGGLFNIHSLEELHNSIEIDDSAFARIFNFFEEFTWHLDDRPLKNDKEINPDVLGYIFEKYINQKDMGAYYTKDDITSFITKGSVIPYLINTLEGNGLSLVGPSGLLTSIISKDPIRYMPQNSVYGLNVPIPESLLDGFEKRNAEFLKNSVPSSHGLPGEVWAEFLQRRSRHESLVSQLKNLEIITIDALVAQNIDLSQALCDLLAESQSPELIFKAWDVLNSTKVMDCACGSGAFLFSALNCLEPIYFSCLDTMECLITEKSVLNIDANVSNYFENVISEIKRHPNKQYFIEKSIVLNNLYGVDIMKEAAEVCKLRLFLKLVSNLSTISEIEPLPDLDFNIKSGNSLVGFVSREELVKQITTASNGQQILLSAKDKKTIERVCEDAEAADRAYVLFKKMQTEHGMGSDQFVDAKIQLRDKVSTIRVTLDRILASTYKVPTDNPKKFDKWLSSHQPFHWFAEYYGPMKSGFSVILGNPPWKEYSKVKDHYTVMNYQTEKCGNLHALFTERGLGLREKTGSLSFIVQLPLASSSRMHEARDILRKNSGSCMVIPFDDRPGKLFEGLQHCRSAIFLSFGFASESIRLYTAKYQRWASGSRGVLFDNISLVPFAPNGLFAGTFPKFSNGDHEEIFRKLNADMPRKLGLFLAPRATKHFVFYQEATQYWIKATVGLPHYSKNGEIGAPAHGRYLYCNSEDHAYAIAAVLNSSLFYAYFVTYGDCFHLSETLVANFPFNEEVINDSELCQLGKLLMGDLKKNATKKTINTKDGDKIAYAEFNASKSKTVMDQIDGIVAKKLGLSPRHIEFITNYDIKFRMNGQETENT